MRWFGRLMVAWLGGFWAACTPGLEQGETLRPLAETPALALLRSDFASTAIDLLDGAGAVQARRWLHSGARPPGLVAALSGDVVLPSGPAPAGELVLIDRLRTDVLTFASFAAGTVRGQLRTHDDAAQRAVFASNPQDLRLAAAGRAWVSRFEPNFDPASAPQEGGDDLIEIDWQALRRTGRRIDLAAARSAIDVSGQRLAVPARPTTLLSLDDATLLVALARLSVDFSRAAPGAVAWVRPAEGQVSVLALPGAQNCARAVPIPDDPGAVLVACFGYAQPFLDEAQTRASAGLFWLRWDAAAATLRLEDSWRPEGNVPIAVQSIVALDGQRAIAVALPPLGRASVDGLYLITRGVAEPRLLHQAAERFVLGQGALDASRAILWWPDASAGGVLRRFEVRGQSVTAAGQRTDDSFAVLPPRQVKVLSPEGA